MRLSQQRLGGCSLICDGLRWDRTQAVVSVNRRILGNVPIRLQVHILDPYLDEADRWELESVLM